MLRAEVSYLSKSKEGFLFLFGPLSPLVARPSDSEGEQIFQIFTYLSVHSSILGVPTVSMHYAWI